MTWNMEKASERIKKLIDSTPKFNIQEFEAHLPGISELRTKSLKKISPLNNLGPNKAIVTNGVHVYVHLISHNEVVLQDKDSEKAQAKALEFLHLHYGACDRVIDDRNAQRIDFHGSRVHAVVVEPSGKNNERVRIIEAIELAKEMMLLSELANKEIGQGKYPARFRIGIDVGPCVAIDSGTTNESEPLFLGSPANHAARLAYGDAPGIFISNEVRKILGIPSSSEYLENIQDSHIEASFSRAIPAKKAAELLSDWKKDIKDCKTDTIRFQFHHHCPPLSDIVYDDLMPSKSIRMPLVSIFADIDGYTNYIDSAVREGRVEEAVRALHVIRREFANVIEEDYKGRKVRFIGDCVHGVIAEGDGREIDKSLTVKVATECVAALRSSFELCKEFLPEVVNLGLAIGFELGNTPISRIGIRGERSVRLAFSTATVASEERQDKCGSNQTAIGPKAYEQASFDIKKIFEDNGVAENLDFSDVSLINFASSYIANASKASSGFVPLKAHCQ